MSSSYEAKTFFVKIEGHENYVGRVVVSSHHTGLSAEIDLLLNETKKILRHVKVLHGLVDHEEAIAESMQVLREELCHKFDADA